LAAIDRPDRDADLAEGFAERAGRRLAGLVELPLRSNVVWV
jgi:hypothetical protein